MAGQGCREDGSHGSWGLGGPEATPLVWQEAWPGGCTEGKGGWWGHGGHVAGTVYW